MLHRKTAFWNRERLGCTNLTYTVQSDMQNTWTVNLPETGFLLYSDLVILHSPMILTHKPSSCPVLLFLHVF